MPGHYHLWIGGVEHNDIIVTNLMYDRHNEDRGILNDYDLAHLSGRERPSGFERMGTMPFMALDLLTEEAWRGKIERRYRHDCESFTWVLLWICCRYNNGKEISNPPLGDFITNDYTWCFGEKCAIYGTSAANITPTDSYQQFWTAAVSLVLLFLKQRGDRQQKTLHKMPIVEPTIDEVVQECRKAVEEQGTGTVVFPQPDIFP